MILESLSLKNFRNHEDRSFRFPPGSTVVLGGNGAGKTNLLEAVHYLSFGRSFRTADDENLVRLTSDYFYLRGETVSGGIRNRTEASYETAGKKILRYDGRTVSARELVARNRSVVFYTDDMNLVLGASAYRRRYLDQLLSQTDPRYLDDLVRYNRTVKQKNSLLKTMKIKKKIPALPVSGSGIPLRRSCPA